jgi:Ca2+-binding RTX toxin-like protein
MRGCLRQSTELPHVTINAQGENAFDWYQFTVPQAGTKVVLDIDHGDKFYDYDDWADVVNSIDTRVFLFDQSGNPLIINNDADIGFGGTGSKYKADSYAEYTFNEPGTYYVAVGENPSLPTYNADKPFEMTGEAPDSDDTYTLQVSMGAAPTLPSNVHVALGDAGSPTQWYLPGTDPSALPHPADGTPVDDALPWHFDLPNGGWLGTVLLHDKVEASSWPYSFLSEGYRYSFRNLDVWDGTKNIALATDADTDLDLFNFVHVDINAGGASDADHSGSNIAVWVAKRGNIVTGEDNDTVTVSPWTNGPEWGNDFRIATGAGSDFVNLDLYAISSSIDPVFDAQPLNRDLIIDGHLTTCYIDMGSGNDFVQATGTRDIIEGGGGLRDTVFYNGSGNGITAYLNESGAVDPRTSHGGTAEGDVLTGVERLVGSHSDDHLFGDGGDNELLGSLGNDVLTGEAGRDVFVFSRNDFGRDDLGDYGRGDDADHITDFTVGEDRIEIRHDPAQIHQQMTTVDGMEGLLVSSDPNPRYGVLSVFLEHVTTELHWHDGHLLV